MLIIIAKSCNYCSFISGPIGEVLNWSGWAPLSRLTYAAYLIHPIVMEVYFKNMFQLIYFEHFTLVSDFEFDAHPVTACITLHDVNFHRNLNFAILLMANPCIITFLRIFE
mgnify:CR=1 FL=1